MKIRTLTATALAAVAMTACGSASQQDVTSAGPTEEAPNMFQSAIDTCGLSEGVLRDNGATLVLDGRGKDDAKLEDGGLAYEEGKLSQQDLGCALGAVGTPSAIIEKMQRTRALDGMQSDAADGVNYTWTYHPDSGLDIIMTLAPSKG